MKNRTNNDLRVQKTRESIRCAFEELICEKNFEEITVKELTERARINRKTFYLHYQTLDDLLREMQDEIAGDFVKRVEQMQNPQDIGSITRAFYDSSAQLGKVGERLNCSGNYRYISRRITDRILAQTWGKTEHAGFSSRNKDPYLQNILVTFMTNTTLEIYRQWVADGRQIPVEKMIELTTELIENGVHGAAALKF